MYKKNECRCSVIITNLGVSQHGNTIVSDISFSVKHSEIMALIGRNGAGKTTILKSIINSVPHTGQIRFFDSSGRKIPSPKIGYVPQKLSFDKDTPITVLDLFCTNSTRFPVFCGHSKERKLRTYEFLEKVGAEKQINKEIGRLSGGELQRVMLAFALDPMPDILLLDEPVAAVDKNGVATFYRIITSMRKEYHMPIIMVSHDLEQISKYATSYALIDKTLLETGRACDMMKSKNIKNMFFDSLYGGGII